MAKTTAKPDPKPADDNKKDPKSDPLLPTTMESLRGKTPEELTKMVGLLDVNLRSLHQTDVGELRSLDEDEQRAFDLGLEIREKAMAILNGHRGVAEVSPRRPQSVETAFNILKSGGLDDIDQRVSRLT